MAERGQKSAVSFKNGGPEKPDKQRKTAKEGEAGGHFPESRKAAKRRGRGKAVKVMDIIDKRALKGKIYLAGSGIEENYYMGKSEGEKLNTYPPISEHHF